jgi:membrane protease YdiL (CAAX protease family)
VQASSGGIVVELNSVGWRAFWERARWWKAIVAVVGYLVLYQLAGLGLGRIFGGLVDTDNVFRTPTSVFFALGAPLVVGAIILVGFAASLGWIRPIFARQPVRGRWWMWIFVVLAVIPIILRLSGIDYGFYGGAVVVTSFGVGLLIGFVEEFLYRGIVVKILRDSGLREWSVAVVSSLIFALSHSLNILSGQPALTVALTVIYTFGFGMLMYLVMRAAGSIVAVMLVHALTDPTTFLAAGAIDASNGAAHSPAIEIAGPFNIVFVGAALIAMIFVRGTVARSTQVTGT